MKKKPQNNTNTQPTNWAHEPYLFIDASNVEYNQAADDGSYAPSFFDIPALKASIPGCSGGMAFWSHRSDRLKVTRWLARAANVKPVIVGRNADDRIIQMLEFCLQQGRRNIVLVTGDGNLITSASKLAWLYGAKLHLASRKDERLSCVAKKSCFDPVMDLAEFITTPPPYSGNPLAVSMEAIM
jgi:hypothetical protein